MIREVFKMKDAIDWIPTSEHETFFSNLKDILAVVQGVKCKLGINTKQRRTSTFRIDQSVIIIKLMIVALAREVTGLIEAINVEEPGNRVLIYDCKMLEEVAD